MADAQRPRRRAYEDAGVTVLSVDPDTDGAVDLAAVLQLLGKQGLTRIMVEGGATLAAGLFRAGLVDRLAWFRSAGIIGGDGLAGIKAFGVDRLAQQPRFERMEITRLGEDILEILQRAT